MKVYPLFILLIFLCSCSGDDDSSATEQVAIDNINLVTGLVIQQNAYDPGIRLGNPNTVVNQTLVYPNPSTGTIAVATGFGAPIQAIWILEGNDKKIYQETDFSTVLNSETYSTEMIQNKAQLEFSSGLTNQVQVNLESLEDGYYRVFIQANEMIEWHNIYLGPVDITEFIESWE